MTQTTFSELEDVPHAKSGSNCFHHRSRPECSCPIHREGEPFTAPLGWRFADDISIEPITRERAEDIYAAHHSYMPTVPKINLVHHGLLYQGETVGAITYRYGLMRKKKLHFDECGQLLPEPTAISEALPSELQAAAREILDEVSTVDVATSTVLPGDAFVEAARICIGMRMPNLASAALARSQEQFIRDTAAPRVKYLLTRVRADFDASMIRALRDKGWTCVGYSKPSRAGNREHSEIRDHYKWCFVCPVSQVREQAALDGWL